MVNGDEHRGPLSEGGLWGSGGHVRTAVRDGLALTQRGACSNEECGVRLAVSGSSKPFRKFCGSGPGWNWQ